MQIKERNPNVQCEPENVKYKTYRFSYILVDNEAEYDEDDEENDEENKKIAAILLTHGHFDHIGAVKELMAQDTRLVIHELDAPMLADPVRNVSLALMRTPSTAPAATDTVREGSVLTLAGLEIRVLHTPGHTPGSSCFLIENHLFTGDTLFEHGWGRTDFPGGDEHALFASLRRLMPMTKDHPFHPGHNA